MLDLTTASSLISLLGVLGIYTFYIERPILDIKSINPCMGGERGQGEEWKYATSGIEVEVHNKGKRDAQNCKGLITFKKMNPITLYLSEEGYALRDTKKFNILAGETKTLSATWGFSKTNSNETIKFDKGDFVDKAPPIEVVIYFGDKTVRKRFEEEDIDKIIRQGEEQVHRSS
jgi:hypothetical protein